METSVQEYIEYVLGFLSKLLPENPHHNLRFENGHLTLLVHKGDFIYPFTLFKEDSVSAEKFCQDLEETINGLD